jgi:hypothetical protein
LLDASAAFELKIPDRRFQRAEISEGKLQIVSRIQNPKSQIANQPEPLPLSLLNDSLYCPRRAALKIAEGWLLTTESVRKINV